MILRGWIFWGDAFRGGEGVGATGGEVRRRGTSGPSRDSNDASARAARGRSEDEDEDARVRRIRIGGCVVRKWWRRAEETRGGPVVCRRSFSSCLSSRQKKRTRRSTLNARLPQDNRSARSRPRSRSETRTPTTHIINTRYAPCRSYFSRNSRSRSLSLSSRASTAARAACRRVVLAATAPPPPSFARLRKRLQRRVGGFRRGEIQRHGDATLEVSALRGTPRGHQHHLAVAKRHAPRRDGRRARFRRFRQPRQLAGRDVPRSAAAAARARSGTTPESVAQTRRVLATKHVPQHHGVAVEGGLVVLRRERERERVRRSRRRRLRPRVRRRPRPRAAAALRDGVEAVHDGDGAVGDGGAKPEDGIAHAAFLSRRATRRRADRGRRVRRVWGCARRG